MPDIQNLEDIKLFSDIFYQKLLADERIKHYFVTLDLLHHMPRIYGFWNMILFGDTTYKTNMMEAHISLNLKKEDFPIWLRHFESSINANFEGEKAEEAISRANAIAMTMRYKLLGI
jgi:hemoglobin